MPAFPRLVRPGLHLTPYLAGELASVLSLAIQRFEDWGLRVRDIGRLHTAAAQLRRVAARGSLGTDPEDLLKTALAAALASDFHLIADAIANDRQDPIADDIMVALGGTLAGSTADSAPYEYQSQYWVGVLLAQSGLKPGVLDTTAQRPDFIVRVHDLSCGVEVKRPSSIEGAKRLIKHAAEQLEAVAIPGVIVVDASSIIGTNSFILPRVGVRARDEIRHLQQEVGSEVAHFIRGYPRPEKFNHVMALLTFARFQVYQTITPPLTDSGFVFSINRYPAYAGQVVRYETELINKLLRGMERVTNNPVRAGWV